MSEISYDDEITLEELDPDGDVLVRTGRGSENNTFHIYEDCSNGPESVRSKDPNVLFQDMVLCPFCRYRREQQMEEAV